MRHYLHILTALLIALMLGACQWSFDHQGSGRSVSDVKIHRFDLLLDEYIQSNSFSTLQKLHETYPQETRFLIEDVLSIGAVSEEKIDQRIREYYSDTLLQELSRDALEKFSDMSRLERDFTRTFRRLKRELPQMPIPRVYAQISALNQSVVVGDSILGFSIDKYMGADYPLYEHFYYDYQRRSMSPERILPDCIKFYLLSEYPFPWEWHRTLLDHLIHQGKIHWVTYKLTAAKSLEEEIGYTPEEDEWCRTHRTAVWNYMVQHGHLLATDPMLIRAYLSPSEYTHPLGQQAPAEVGVWLGIHIVDEYMQKHEEMSIADLLRTTDYRGILKDLQLRF